MKTFYQDTMLSRIQFISRKVKFRQLGPSIRTASMNGNVHKAELSSVPVAENMHISLKFREFLKKSDLTEALKLNRMH